MAKNLRRLLKPFYRKHCCFEHEVWGETELHVFDAENEKKGVKWLVETHIGSTKTLAEQLKKQLRVVPEEAVPFAICYDLYNEDRRHTQNLYNYLQGVDDEEVKVWAILFYNPQNGSVYINVNKDGTKDIYLKSSNELRFEVSRRKLDKLKVREYYDFD